MGPFPSPGNLLHLSIGLGLGSRACTGAIELRERCWCNRGNGPDKIMLIKPLLSFEHVSSIMFIFAQSLHRSVQYFYMPTFLILTNAFSQSQTYHCSILRLLTPEMLTLFFCVRSDDSFRRVSTSIAVWGSSFKRLRTSWAFVTPPWKFLSY